MRTTLGMLKCTTLNKNTHLKEPLDSGAATVNIKLGSFLIRDKASPICHVSMQVNKYLHLFKTIHSSESAGQ